MEQFHWTPQQIDEIPFGRLQRLFLAMEQRNRSTASFEQQKLATAVKKKKK